MRIAICASGEIYGGVERHVHGLAQRLGARGHEVRVLLFHDREPVAQLRETGVAVEILPLRGAWDPGGPGRLADRLRDAGAELIHAHGYKSVVNGAVAARRLGLPLAITMHGLVEPAAGDPIRWLKTRFYGWLQDRSARGARAAVAYVTDGIRRAHDRPHRGLRREVVYNGIDPLDRSAYPRPPELDDDRLHLGLVGRLAPVKGVETALRALGDGDAVLDIVGDGPSRAELESLAGGMGLGERVRFHGYRRDVLAFIAAFDALLMPSLHEGLPYTLLEALSLGVPVLCSRVGGLAEILTHERDALLFEVGDAAGLAEAIGRIAADPGLRGTLGRAGRDLQAASFTLDGMTEAYLDLYRTASN